MKVQVRTTTESLTTHFSERIPVVKRRISVIILFEPSGYLIYLQV